MTPEEEAQREEADRVRSLWYLARARYAQSVADRHREAQAQAE